MKKFILQTISSSSDHYTYFIEHPTRPTGGEIERFLKEYACDKDDEEVYEEMDGLIEVDEELYLTIPE